MDLFADQEQAFRDGVEPLAVRMRPRCLDEFVGQNEFLGEGKLLRRMLEADRITSALFYGPAGTGKTSLARVMARSTRAHFEQVNAAAVGVKEIREILEHARQRLGATGQRTILFVDELHRFNRAQQDILLDDVENGTIILVGATTENPFFAINAPLVSRSQVFQFTPLSDDEMKTILRRAIQDSERGFGQWDVRLEDNAASHLAKVADGDARRALAALEIAVLSQKDRTTGAASITITEDVAAESIQQKAIRYDKAGDEHYNAISAMIKSIRGSDPDAAVYWLARMLQAGEDPRYIARRIVIAASEDIGNADPQGLMIAQAAAQATQMIGLPECELPLAQAAIYLACAPKSNACAAAIGKASEDIRKGRTLPVPKHLQSAGYAGAKRLGAGKGYLYPHSQTDGIVRQEYLGVDRTYYEPVNRGDEVRISQYLARVRAQVQPTADQDGQDQRGGQASQDRAAGCPPRTS